MSQRTRLLSFAGAKPRAAESGRGAGKTLPTLAPSPIPLLLAFRKAGLLPTLRPETRSLLTPRPLPAAFVSKQEGSEVAKRLRRYLDQGLG